jgi:hypothetical protein
MIALTFRWLRRQRSEGPPGQLGRVHFGRRVWALSGGLLVAWVSVAVVIAAGGSLLDISWLHTSASVICCVACWVHLVTSKGRELSQP